MLSSRRLAPELAMPIRSLLLGRNHVRRVRRDPDPSNPAIGESCREIPLGASSVPSQETGRYSGCTVQEGLGA
jgi:hypothetical protein